MSVLTDDRGRLRWLTTRRSGRALGALAGGADGRQRGGGPCGRSARASPVRLDTAVSLEGKITELTTEAELDPQRVRWLLADGDPSFGALTQRTGTGQRRPSRGRLPRTRWT